MIVFFTLTSFDSRQMRLDGAGVYGVLGLEISGLALWAWIEVDNR